MRRNCLLIDLGFTAVFLIMAVVPPAEAIEIPQKGWSLENLMSEFSLVKSATGCFIERKSLRILSAPIILSGMLTYTAPDRLEKNTLKPQHERLVVKGGRLTIWRKGCNNCTFLLKDAPPVWALVESIRSTLSGNSRTLNRFFNVHLKGKDSGWTLLLVPKEEKLRIMLDSIRISGKKNRIDSIDIQERNGDRSIMKVMQNGTAISPLLQSGRDCAKSR